MATKGKEVGDVVVKLVSAEPPLEYLPVVLHPMGMALSTTGTGREGVGTFRLRPVEKEYIDVLRFIPEEDQPGRLQLDFQSPLGRHSSVEMASYKFTLEATCDKGQSTKAQFMLDWNPHGPAQFRQVNTT